LGDQPEHDADEEEGEGGDGDPVGEIPLRWNVSIISYKIPALERDGEGGKREREKYQGIPTCNCCCTVKKLALVPSIVALPTIMMSSQKFNCMAGQWYFVRVRATTTSV